MSPRKVLNLIDHLPRSSAYSEAMAQDDELAAQWVDKPQPRFSIPLTEWTPEREALAELIDRVAEVFSAVILARTGKAPKVKRSPRPTTAVDRARARSRKEASEELARMLFPNRTD